MAIAEGSNEDTNKLSVQPNGNAKKEAIPLKDVDDKNDEVN
jgi:hypothetical protein